MRLYMRRYLQQIESRPREGSGSSSTSRGRVSTLSLVDLAGSESAKLNTQGERQLEGSFINKSLLTLGHIIYKLTEEDRPQRRDSSAASRKCLYVVLTRTGTLR
jgi:Kinesin motor domain